MYIVLFILGLIFIIFGLIVFVSLFAGALWLIGVLTKDLNSFAKWFIRIMISPFVLGFVLIFGRIFYFIPIFAGLALLYAGHT